MHGRFRTVEQDKLFQPEGTELAAEFATDRTGCSCYHYHFIFKRCTYLIHIDTYLITPQQVFNTDFRKITQGPFTFYEFIYGGQNQHMDLLLLAIADQTLTFVFYGLIVYEQYCFNIFTGYQTVKFSLSGN